MMESSAVSWALVLLASLILQGSYAETRYYVKMKTNSTSPYEASLPGLTRGASQEGKTRSSFRIDDETMIRESLKANLERRNSFVESSTFDPDVLNKFLDDYANKIKSTTEKSYDFPFRVTKPLVTQQLVDKNEDRGVEISTIENEHSAGNRTTENIVNSTLDTGGPNQQDLNDTLKRNKYFGSNANDDRNGWVTLDAIPWSKSKISKWQANPSSQRPWPDTKQWDKPNSAGKPWNSEFPSRPAYVNNEPWYEAPKPYRPDYHQDRLSSQPQASTRPSYFSERYDEHPSQAQKWPPERPASSWEKFPSSDSYRPHSDIITDERPSNFPNSWDKFGQSTPSKPKYPFSDNRDRFTSSNNNNNNKQLLEMSDWSDAPHGYPSKFHLIKDKPSSYQRPDDEPPSHQHHSSGRPHLSSYQYTPEHPPNHPSSGDGQWVLLSTNHGYSKSRQRSIKFDPVHTDSSLVEKLLNATKASRSTKQDNDGTVAVMTSKRQVRLTVLPSVNGTNTTTSHGGLLEVERTFKTVDQSQKEYEADKLSQTPVLLKKRPMRQTQTGRPSNSAVLAAVGAGMLPATMAMMIPMMLGRKKRSLDEPPSPRGLNGPYELLGSLDSRGRAERKRKKLSSL